MRSLAGQMPARVLFCKSAGRLDQRSEGGRSAVPPGIIKNPGAKGGVHSANMRISREASNLRGKVRFCQSEIDHTRLQQEIIGPAELFPFYCHPGVECCAVDTATPSQSYRPKFGTETTSAACVCRSRSRSSHGGICWLCSSGRTPAFRSMSTPRKGASISSRMA